MQSKYKTHKNLQPTSLVFMSNEGKDFISGAVVWLGFQKWGKRLPIYISISFPSSPFFNKRKVMDFEKKGYPQ